MQNYNEKLALLSEMISFALIDGKLHEREFAFLSLIAKTLHISDEELQKLFKENTIPLITMKSEFDRIHHFYRLALLMHVDGVLHEKEEVEIKQIGLNMGLDPWAVKRVLFHMEMSDDKMIDAAVLLRIFKEQMN